MKQVFTTNRSDSMRACVAALLDLDIDDVPAFGETSQPQQIVLHNLTAFLRPHKLYPLVNFYPHPPEPGEDFSYFDFLRGLYMVSGSDGRCVVGFGRAQLAHDPDPRNLERKMIEPCHYCETLVTGYWVYLFVRLCE